MSECYPRFDLDMRLRQPVSGTSQPDYTVLLNAIANDLNSIKTDLINASIWKIEQDRRIGLSQWGVWTVKRAQNYDVLYEHKVTYAGTTTTIDLDFMENVRLRRIEMVHDDNTVKTYEIQLFNDYEKNSSYNILKSSTANQDTTWMQGYDLFMPAGSRLRFYFSNYTVGKINSIAVGVEEV